MDKAGMANRLGKAGLRNQAEAYMDEVRHRIGRDQGGKQRDRAEVNAAAWSEMWDTFRPCVERIEQQIKKQKTEKVPPPEPALTGLPADIDSVLDPDYTEPDPGKQLRDGLLWTVSEWMRVVRDTPEGPVITLDRAGSPPPNAYALFILSSYALAPGDKRRDLISRSLAFATRGYDAPDATDPEHVSSGGFLNGLE